MWGFFLRFQTFNISRHYFFPSWVFNFGPVSTKLNAKNVYMWLKCSIMWLGNICFHLPSGKPFVLDLFGWRPEYILYVCKTSKTKVFHPYCVKHSVVSSANWHCIFLFCVGDVLYCNTNYFFFPVILWLV